MKNKIIIKTCFFIQSISIFGNFTNNETLQKVAKQLFIKEHQLLESFPEPYEIKSISQAIHDYQSKFGLYEKTPITIPFNNVTAVLNLAKPYLPNDPVIIEAGAYNGNDSVYMSNFLPKSKIYAFEPVPKLYMDLVNKTQNYANIFTSQYALGDKNDTVKFYISAFNNNPQEPSASSSLLEPKEHLEYASYVVFNQTINVEMLTLDTWANSNNIDHIDMLWLDMQGYELNMLKACPETLKRVKVIYTEVEFVEAYKDQYLYHDVVSYLNNLGFKILAQDFTPGESSRWYGNVLFINNTISEKSN